MKYLFLVFSFFLMSQTAIAQIEKGSFLLDGGVNTGHHQEGSFTNTYFSIQQDIGYMLNNRMMVGGGYSLSTTFNLEQRLTSVSSLFRYYLANKEKKAWFIGNRITVFGRTYSIDTGIGFSHFLSPSILWESKATYRYQSGYAGYDYSNFIVGSGLKFFLNKGWKKEMSGWKSVLNKGSWIIGGTSSSLTFGPSATQLNINPNIGYFLSDRWVIGGLAGVDWTGINDYSLQITRVHIQSFTRYYFSPSTARTIGFIEGGLGLAHQRFTAADQSIFFNNDGLNSYNTTTAIYFGAVGMDVFLSPTVALELKGQYQKLEQNTRNINLIFGFQFFL